MMRLLSVNVSLPQHALNGNHTVATGIFKEPVAGRVMLRRLNLEGDGQADLQNHGGEYKAVYAYAAEHYEFWKRELGRDGLPPGQFGENFSVQGMDEDTVHVGDVFRVGSALIQVTQPRSPCYKLALKMGLPHFPKQFLASGRVGFYLRVLEEGQVGAGDIIERLRIDPERMTVRQMVHLLYVERDDRKALERALRIQALSPRRRAAFQEQLCKGGECG